MPVFFSLTEIWTLALNWAQLIGSLLVIGLLLLVALPFARELAALGRVGWRSVGARLQRWTEGARTATSRRTTRRQIELSRTERPRGLVRSTARRAD